ncbi:(2Fe-2S)-binding protein [Candidatus Dojkabacteria bacterium]|nr:(2Fe-2S)-binding protein [Candidatus Dojkabacteria bacterium]
MFPSVFLQAINTCCLRYKLPKGS